MWQSVSIRSKNMLYPFIFIIFNFLCNCVSFKCLLYRKICRNECKKNIFWVKLLFYVNWPRILFDEWDILKEGIWVPFFSSEYWSFVWGRLYTWLGQLNVIEDLPILCFEWWCGKPHRALGFYIGVFEKIVSVKAIQ